MTRERARAALNRAPCARKRTHGGGLARGGVASTAAGVEPPAAPPGVVVGLAGTAVPAAAAGVELVLGVSLIMMTEVRKMR